MTTNVRSRRSPRRLPRIRVRIVFPRLWLVAAVLLASAVVGGMPARAALDVSLGASIDLDDDTSIYLGVSSRYFRRPADEVEVWSRRVAHPDDTAVLFFLASRSHQSPEAIFALRRRGLSWWEIGRRVHVPVDVWFVPVPRDPGPPYGKAYGHWRKHGRRGGFAVSDDEARHLVSVRVIHEYYGVPVERAMQMRAGGRPLSQLVGTEYRVRHGGKHRASASPRRGSDGPRPADQGRTERGKRGPSEKGGKKHR